MWPWTWSWLRLCTGTAQNACKKVRGKNQKKMDALGTRTLWWFTHGCSGYRMHSEHESYYGFGMDAVFIGCSGNANVIMVLGMDALVIRCTGNTNVIVVYAWMLWVSDAFGTPVLYSAIMVWAWMLWLSDAMRTRMSLWSWVWMPWLSDALGTGT